MTFNKKLGITVIAFVFTAYARAGDAWVSVGSASSSSGGGTSLSIAGKGAGRWGFGLGVVFNSEYSDSNVLDYPVPHSSYRSLGEKRVGNTLGMDGYYFLSESDTFRPYVGVGLYTNNKKTLAQSTVTNWIYTQKDSGGVLVSAEIGMQAKTSTGLIFGVGIHSVRGPNIAIGKSF